MLALRYDWRGTSLLTLHNFAEKSQTVVMRVGGQHDDVLTEVFDDHHSRRQNDGAHRIRLGPYAWRWYRVGSEDNTLNMSDLTLTEDRVK